MEDLKNMSEDALSSDPDLLFYFHDTHLCKDMLLWLTRVFRRGNKKLRKFSPPPYDHLAPPSRVSTGYLNGPLLPYNHNIPVTEFYFQLKLNNTYNLTTRIFCENWQNLENLLQLLLLLICHLYWFISGLSIFKSGRFSVAGRSHWFWERSHWCRERSHWFR